MIILQPGRRGIFTYAIPSSRNAFPWLDPHPPRTATTKLLTLMKLMMGFHGWGNSGTIFGGCLGGSVIECLPLAPGVILGSRDPVPYRAP